MISNEHKKHTKLAKAVSGHFHKNEWAVLGTDCNTIKSISDSLSLSLSNLKTIYIDADHDDDASSYFSKDGKMTINSNFNMLNAEFEIQMQ